MSPKMRRMRFFAVPVLVLRIGAGAFAFGRRIHFLRDVGIVKAIDPQQAFERGLVRPRAIAELGQRVVVVGEQLDIG